MMGVYIKGMEMPAEGEYNLTLYVCSDGSAYMDVASFPVDLDKFETFPVPPHGDLIERDALLKGDGRYIISFGREGIDVAEIERAPVIIPANEKGE